MEPGLLDSIGKLSIEVVAILTLTYIVILQGKGHDKMCKAIDKLTIALTENFERDHSANKAVIKSIEDITYLLNGNPKVLKRPLRKLAKKA